MGHVIVVFGALIAVNLGLGYMVSDYLYEEDAKEGVVEVQEVDSELSPEQNLKNKAAEMQSETGSQ